MKLFESSFERASELGDQGGRLNVALVGNLIPTTTGATNMAAEMVPLAELCEAAGVDGKRARARVRAAGMKKGKEGGWAWARGSAALAEAKRIIKGEASKEPAKKSTAKPKAAKKPATKKATPPKATPTSEGEHAQAA